jgi:2,3-bisphosphoglycerate-independent phosphoglycerate mutase
MPPANVQHRPCILIVRDGWGENPHGTPENSAIRNANPPFDRQLRSDWPMTLVETSGFDVGLPEGTMGNSEVGHQNLGAGRIVDQDSVRITKAIREGTFFQNAELVAAVETCKARGGKLHVMGLASDIGVHSLLEHLYACVELAAKRELTNVYVHCFMDGRDSPPTSGVGYIKDIEAKLKGIGVGAIASVCGRYWAMDRDNRWDRVEKAYRMLVHGDANAAPSATAAVQRYYDNPIEPNMTGDEFVTPTVISEDGRTPIATVEDGDAVIFFNFRGDRPRELTKAFVLEEFPYEETDKRTNERVNMGFDRGKLLDLFYVGMTQYEKSLPIKTAYPKPPKMTNIAGEYLSSLGLTQFRCAETEKYPHVTFFFNDYRDEPFPGERAPDRPDSPKVATYDLQPEMSAYGVTDVMLKRIDERHRRLHCAQLRQRRHGRPHRLARGGHQGLRVVDECVGKVFDAVIARAAADHHRRPRQLRARWSTPRPTARTPPTPLASSRCTSSASRSRPSSSAKAAAWPTSCRPC